MLSNQAKIESLIFVSGNEGITVAELAQLCGIMKPAVLEQLNNCKKNIRVINPAVFNSIKRAIISS